MFPVANSFDECHGQISTPIQSVIDSSEPGPSRLYSSFLLVFLSCLRKNLIIVIIVYDNNSIAVILQTQIFEDFGKESLHPEFHLEIELPYENGGHVDPEDIKAEVLDGETFDNPALRERILAGVVPLKDSISRQINNYILKINQNLLIECRI